MRRYALLFLAALLMYSCASTGDEGVEGEAAADDAARPEVVAPVDGGEAPAEPGGEEPPPPSGEGAPNEEVPPKPELLVREPADITRAVAREFPVRVAASSGELDSVEIELLSGPVLTQAYELTDLSAIDAAERTATLSLRDGAAVVRLPDGLVDGEAYTWRARGVTAAGEQVTWTEPQTTLLELGYEAPELDPVFPTIDQTPSISWEAVDLFQGYQISVTDDAGSPVSRAITQETGYTLPMVEPGRYQVRVRALLTNGIVSRQSGPLLVRVLDDATPELVWPRGGETTLSQRVGLHWSPVTGAVSYEARYREVGAEDWVSLETSAEPFAALDAAASSALADGATVEWQARARNEVGKLFSWSAAARFRLGDFSLEFATVVAAGEEARFARGYDGGSRDEAPVRDIVLTRPYEMSVTPLTNEQVARIVNYALERGMVAADESGVFLTEERIVPLIGLGEMDYGQQLGLLFRDGRVVVEEGYEQHPAVGITWHGAVQIANGLSFVEGRTAAYDGTGSSWDQTAAGYRLPTEAEWEYAARGNTTRLYPWSGALSGRVANYYRSFDPFEDVNEPFTSAGGPTTPVRFFSGRTVSGFQTVSDASPFDIRDLVGNVWEWCWDRYDPGYYAASPDTDPSGPDESDFATENEAIVLAVSLDPNQRVVRGTAWNSRAPDVRLTNRGRYTELGRSYSIGLRLVRNPLP